jgi:hypothetical protein
LHMKHRERKHHVANESNALRVAARPSSSPMGGAKMPCQQSPLCLETTSGGKRVALLFLCSNIGRKSRVR